MESSGVADVCFVEGTVHHVSKSKYPNLAEHLIRLNNYDHVTAVVFNKLKTLLNDASLSRFKKPTPKICLACCSHLTDLVETENIHVHTKKRKIVSSTTEPSALSTEDASFKTLVNEIKTRTFTEDQLQTLMQAVGERLAPLANRHVAELNKKNIGDRLTNMSTMTYNSYWDNAFVPFKHFVLGLMHGNGKRTETEETRNCRIRFGIHAIETIYSVVNLNYTSPFVLAEMLYMYFLSNSRRVCEIYGAATGGGSFPTLQKSLEKISKIPTNFPKDGYVVVAFDNNQVLAKTHRVQLNSGFKVNVVTSLAGFELLNVTNPQMSEMCLPLFYQPSPNDASALNEKLKQFTSSSLKLVNQYLLKFLQRRLTIIESSMGKNGSDYVTDSSIPPPKGHEGLPYIDIAQFPSSCQIYDQECLLVNPNSYKTVRQVLEHIQKLALSENRQWVTVVVDGIPFTLAQELIRKSFYCHICNEILMEKDIPVHYITLHQLPSPPQLQRVFTNILLRPGAGHYEMNMLKALFEGWFPLFLEPVTELLGFLSPKAKMYVKNCSDHHKAWQILEITFESVSDELLRSYSETCKNNTPSLQATVEGFFQKVSESMNENAKAAFQFAYYWCFPILLFRGGIRRNNFDVAIKAREQASGLFYVFRHPKYQLINCLDIAELVQMPSEVRNVVYRESMVIPRSNVGQGIDFLLEQRNRRMKNYVIHNGVPTNEQWKAASSSMQNLDKIVDTVEDRLNIQISSGQHKMDHSPEKKAARSLFRSHGFLDLTKKTEVSLLPMLHYEQKPFNSILRCQSIAEVNRKAFYEGTIKTGKATVTNYISLFKSDCEGEVVNTWGMTKLRTETKKMSKCLSKDLQKDINLELKSSDLNKLRETYWLVMNLFENEEEEEDNKLQSLSNL